MMMMIILIIIEVNYPFQLCRIQCLEHSLIEWFYKIENMKKYSNILIIEHLTWLKIRSMLGVQYFLHHLS